MIERGDLLTLVIAVSLAGVLLVYGYAVTLEPDNKAIADLNEKDIGRLVSVEGLLRHIFVMPSGAAGGELADPDSNATVELFISEEAWKPNGDESAFRPGAVIRASGAVSEYGGALEITISSPNDLVLVSAPEENHIPVDALLSRPGTFQGMTVSVEGRIAEAEEAWDDTHFELRAEHGQVKYSLHVIVQDWSLSMDGGGIAEGSDVVVTGAFDYYQPEGQWQLSAETIAPSR